MALVSELESQTQVARGVEQDKGIYNVLMESPTASNACFRASLVKLMLIALQCWEQNTGKSKIDLAEESKLWRVSIDNGQLRVCTLDRYLDISKLPKLPRWHQVIKTAYFVLDTIKSESSIRDELEITLQALLERQAP